MSLKTNLKAVYKLDKTSGSVKDETGNGNDGTNNGATRGVSGKDGNAFDFNRSNSDDVSGILSSPTSPSGYSISAWVKPSTLQNGGLYTIVGEETNDEFYLRISGNKAEFVTNDGSGTKAQGSTNLQTGQWYHLVGTYDSSNGYKIYVDGSLDGSNGATTWRNSSSSPMNIGSTGSRFYFDGKIDEVYIYDRALSSSEVSDLNNSGNGFFYPFATATVFSLSAALNIATDTPAQEDLVVQIPQAYQINSSLKDSGLFIKIPSSTKEVGTGTRGTRFLDKEWPIKEGLSAGITKQTGDPVLREE